MHRRSKRILIGIAVMVALLATAYAIALARATTHLRQAYAALAKDSRPMNAADLIPPQVPDEQNGAVLYEKAASLLKTQPMGRKTFLEVLADRSSRFVSGSLDAEDLAEYRQWMGQQTVSSALSLAEQAAQRPACRSRRDYQSDPLNDPPVFADMRDLARIMGARAYAEMQANEPNKAWDTALTRLRMAVALAGEPSCEGQTTHCSMVRAACASIQRLCEAAMPGEDKAEAIDALLSSLDMTGAVVHALDGERLLRGEWLFNLPEDRLRQVLRRAPLGNDSRLFVCAAAFRPRFVADHATYLQTMRQCTQLALRPYSLQDANAIEQVRHLASTHFLTQGLGFYVCFSREFAYRAAADVSMTRAGLAVLQYRHNHGAFPQTLEAISLKGLIDPYTRGPLHYRAEGDGFVVYSEGEDLKDNGGIPRQRDQKTDFDQVWRFPSPK